MCSSDVRACYLTPDRKITLSVPAQWTQCYCKEVINKYAYLLNDADATLCKTNRSIAFLMQNSASEKEIKKGKVRPRTDHEGPEGEQRYSSTLSLTSALDGIDC